MRISSFSTATSRRAQGRSTLTREASSQGGTTLRAHIVPAALLAFVGATFVGATGARAGFGEHYTSDADEIKALRKVVATKPYLYVYEEPRP